MKLTVVDLFCGTKSIANAFAARGHQTFTADFDQQHNPDLVENILNVDVDSFPFPWQKPDVVWASPPCQTFSVASIGTHWGGGANAYEPKTDAARVGLAILEKTVAIIKELDPKYFFIENPRGMMRKTEVMKRMPLRNTVTYCQYGDTRMKPTDIWTNCFIWNPRPTCKNGAPCHEAAPRGSKTGTQGVKGSVDRSRIPDALCQEIVKVCEFGHI